MTEFLLGQEAFTRRVRNCMRNLIIALVSIFSAAGCEDSSEQEKQGQTIELVTASAKPGQLIIAKASRAITMTPSSTVTVNGDEVEAHAVDVNQVAFILPEVPAGTAMIDYSPIGISKKLSLTVEPYTAIKDPLQALDVFSTKTQQIIEKASEYVDDPIVKLDARYVDLLVYLRRIIEDHFGDLSNEEKRQVAYLLQNSIPDPAEFLSDDINPAFYARTASSFTDPSDALWDTAKELAPSVTATLGFGFAGIKLAGVPTPDAISKLSAAACLVTSTAYLVKTLEIAEKVGALKGVAEAVSDIRGRLKAEELVFKRGVTKRVTFRGDYRNLVREDEAAFDAGIGEIFASEKKLSTFYNAFVDAINRVISWFPLGAPDVPRYNSPVRSQKSYLDYPLAGTKLQLLNVSDASIELASTASDTALAIKATSKTPGKEKHFTFDVVYTDENLGVTATRNVAAVLTLTEPKSLRIVSGNFQGGEPESYLADSLIVEVLDAHGLPLEGKDVQWSTGTFDGTLAAKVTTTGPDGRTGNRWKLSTATEGYQYTAYASVSTSEGYIVDNVAFKANAFRCVPFTVTHWAGDVAPVTKTVTYGTVRSTLSGMTQCWITQNLGADRAATSSTDASEAAAGWYWKFNRKQGYKHDGNARTPDLPAEAINENFNWQPSNDPCTALLGQQWRMPTDTEWENAYINGAWTPNSAYSSELKLHRAGFLRGGDILEERGVSGKYWSPTHYNPYSAGGNEGILGVSISDSQPVKWARGVKTDGASIRCLTY